MLGSMVKTNVCNDWLMVGGHCHYAKDLYWFGDDYKKMNPLKVDNEHDVIGIGTVVLVVRCSTKNMQTKTLILKNVLHIPNASCNGFEYKSLFSNSAIVEGRLSCFDNDKRQICYGVEIPCKYAKLVLSEQIGMSLLFGVIGPFFPNIYLNKKEMKGLFGNVYPLYSMDNIV